eukprot:CAMPEP_0174697154 /NCGR_PEP_ID=MMETSP1094-20130205/3099_1 /TAXON_ID=156173 /ORGANISM="Chrysochromulina brevifilum, Strain UTEX LB 985" /LENGTH=73 /DNA_ID=CAMNT_0015894083 /DNA_START=386 /DNA_END=607 /DNA_ORIENTATION=+
MPGGWSGPARRSNAHVAQAHGDADRLREVAVLLAKVVHLLLGLGLGRLLLRLCCCVVIRAVGRNGGICKVEGA